MWFLPNVNMNQPQTYTCPLPLKPPSNPSRLSQNTGFKFPPLHSTFVYFVSNLMLLLIWQEVPVCGPEVGDPCSKCLRRGLHRIQLSILWLFYSHPMCICLNYEIRLEFAGSKTTSQTHSQDAWTLTMLSRSHTMLSSLFFPSCCSSSCPFLSVQNDNEL